MYNTKPSWLNNLISVLVWQHIISPHETDEFAKLGKMEEKEWNLQNKALEKNIIKNSIEKWVSRSMSKTEASNSKWWSKYTTILYVYISLVSFWLVCVNFWYVWKCWYFWAMCSHWRTGAKGETSKLNLLAIKHFEFRIL